MSSIAIVERASMRRALLRLVGLAAVLCLAVASLGCGKPFNVKTQPDFPSANYAAKASANGIGVQAQAMTDEDILYDTFDANLLMAGVLPVRLMLTNSADQSMELKTARLRVRGQTNGRSFKAVKAREAFERLISYYGISVYNKFGYKESLNLFSGYALDTNWPLAGGQSRQGLVFFLMPSEAARGSGLTLLVSRPGSKRSGSGTTIELKMN